MNTLFLFTIFVNILINKYYGYSFLYKSKESYDPAEILNKISIKFGQFKKNLNISHQQNFN